MMAFFNGYPATYQPYYTPVQQPQQSNTGNGIIWVQGEAGAKSYLVAPNSTVQLWDSESQTIYLKSADASGMPGMKILDYTVREPGKMTPNSVSSVKDDKLSAYATKDEIRAVSDEIKVLRGRLDKLTRKEDGDE